MIIYEPGYELPGTVAVADAQLIIEMEHRGATVILDDTGREYVIKVRIPGQRQIRLASTSGYPVKWAYEAWKETQA